MLINLNTILVKGMSVVENVVKACSCVGMVPPRVESGRDDCLHGKGISVDSQRNHVCRRMEARNAKRQGNHDKAGWLHQEWRVEKWSSPWCRCVSIALVWHYV